MISKQDLLALGTSDLRSVDLGGGKTIYVKALALSVFESAQKMIADGKQPFAVWILFSACDDKGTRLFADTEFDAILSLPVKVSQDISLAAIELNGLGKTANDAEKN